MTIEYTKDKYLWTYKKLFEYSSFAYSYERKRENLFVWMPYSKWNKYLLVWARSFPKRPLLSCARFTCDIYAKFILLF